MTIASDSCDDRMRAEGVYRVVFGLGLYMYMPRIQAISGVSGNAVSELDTGRYHRSLAFNRSCVCVCVCMLTFLDQLKMRDGGGVF